MRQASPAPTLEESDDFAMKQQGRAKSEWNSAPAGKRKGVLRAVGRDQLDQAIRSFQERGGLIRTLPPQNVGRRYSVGGNLDSGFENVIDS